MTLPVRTILITGLYAGLLDGLAAVWVIYIRSGRTPDLVFQYIASALLGNPAFSGGLVMTLLGVLLHMLIAVIWSFLYFLVCSCFPPRRRHPARWIIPGVLYGIVVWLIMNLVVLPISKVTQPPFTATGVGIGISVLILCIGIPIAWSAHRKYTTRQ